MPSSVYVDINIVVDVCDATRPTAQRSRDRIADLLREEIPLFVNADSLSNLFYHSPNEDALRYVCARKIDAEAILSNDQRFVSPDVAVWRR
jgi:predicted nucleic acid-binding protein